MARTKNAEHMWSRLVLLVGGLACAPFLAVGCAEGSSYTTEGGGTPGEGGAGGMGATSATVGSSSSSGGIVCGPGVTLCGSDCVDTDNDPANCGACGNACAAGEVCSAGACGLQCTGGSTLCNGSCVNTKNDPANCGSCGYTCPAGNVCSAGSCGLQCGGGTVLCGAKCVDTDNDSTNCGSCGFSCGPGEICSGSICMLQCAGGSTQCGDICTNTSFDPMNCGSCGNVCPGAANATGTCAGGACVLSCNASFKDCTAANGCETNVASDPMNCGGCGTACAVGDFCVNGFCSGAQPCGNPGGGSLVHANGAVAGEMYCYDAGDSTQTRALKACESHFGVGQCCIITGGYQDMQYGQCGGDGWGTSIHWHWDNHPDGHCAPYYVVGDVVSPGWCGNVLGSFTN